MRALVAARDPALLDAVADVDRTLIRAWLDRDCWERVRLTAENAALIEELRSWRKIG